MKHARSLVAALLVLLAALCGCAGERSGLPSTASPAWTYRGHALLSPIASESDATVLVAAESPTRLIALNASDGRELWSVEAGGRTVLCGGGVTLAQRAPSFTREPAEVVALDTRTGKELWRTSRWRAWPAPRLQSGLAVGFTVDRTFEAVDARTGERIFAFDPAPNRVAAPKPPYSEDPADVDFWSASALTASGKLAYRGPEASFAVVDLRAGRVVEIPAPEMGYRTGIVAVGERVVVVGGSPGADEYRVDAFDAAAGTMLWSKRVAGRRAERVEAGPGETVVLLDAATADYGGPTVRAYAEHVYDAATGEELGPEPFEVRKRDSLHLGGPFGELAVLRDAPSLRAYSLPGWRGVWATDTQDPDVDNATVIAASNVVLMRSDTRTTRLGGSFVSESRITAFDLETGALLWRYVGDEVRYIAAIGDLAIGVGSNRVVALPLRPGPRRRWWPW